MIVIFEGNVRFTVHTNIYRFRSRITQGLGIVRTGFITKVDCFLFYIKRLQYQTCSILRLQKLGGMNKQRFTLNNTFVLGLSYYCGFHAS